MALRYLAGKLRVPAGTALRRAERSRGVASHSSQGRPSCSCQQLGSAKEGVTVEAPRGTSKICSKEETQRIADVNEEMIRRINEASLSRERYDRLETLYVSGGALVGLFVGVLIVRCDNYTGGKISNWVLGLPTD